uniref:cytochrome b n=1 Tax=Thyonella gemmata TaxID=206685 RepID=UPI001D113988|nr:cytochrome b [Thyonella gemmata]QZM06636.1 cytochrome b [Thyonella gemmata]
MTGPIRKNHPLLRIANNSIVDLPSPSNLSYWWNFGSLLGLCLVIQLITGLFLSMHYSANTSDAFAAINHICRNVNNGWILRNIHANTSSIFFLSLFCHIGRNIYFGSYLNRMTWNIGIILFLITTIIAFLGYVLPWGNMSYWAATVITNLLTSIPYIGNELTQWIWGGYSIGNPTLTRFYSFHFMLPFILALMSIIHLLFLHENGSNNPTGINSNIDKIPFHPYYSMKDILGIAVLLTILLSLATLVPNITNETENFNIANTLETPPHIQPEWYFLFVYAILRSIPNKLGGVIALVAAIGVWAIIPIIHCSQNQSATFNPLSQINFWILASSFFALTWLGAEPLSPSTLLASQIYSIVYFSSFLIMIPIVSITDNNLHNPNNN